jgi:hypothetical protein
MIKKIINKFGKSKFKVLLIISFLICISSINTVQADFTNFFYLEEKNFYNYLNFYRFIAPTIIIILLCSFLTFKKNFDKLLLYFFFYGIWQIFIFTIQGKNPSGYIVNYQLIFNSVSILLIFLLADQYRVRIEKKVLFILIGYITLISLFFYSKLVLEFFSNKNLLYLYGTNTLLPESQTFQQATPKVTGLARMFVIIFYFVFFYQLNINNKLLKILFFVISFFLIIGVYSTQTRGGIIGILIFAIFYLFLFKEKLIKKIFYIFLFILIPITTFEGIIYLKKKINTSINETNLKNNNIIDSRIIHNISSSGRIAIWKTSLNIIKEKKIFLGKGPQADRLLLLEHQAKVILEGKLYLFDISSSNALIYSYLCGGILSFSIFIIIYFLILKQIFLYLFIKKQIIKKKFIVNFALLTLIFLTVRTVFENGYSIFGVDYLFCITCYYILIKSYKIKKLIPIFNKI